MVFMKAQQPPRYYLIYQDLYRDIAGGAYQVGQKLPSEAELCEHYKVSRGTVREAVKMLFQQGLLIREQGRGTFITNRDKIGQDAFRLMGFTELMERHQKEPGGKLIDLEIQKPNPTVQTLLQLDEGAEVVRVERLRMGDDEPLIIERSYFVHALFSPLLDFDLEKESIYALLLRETDLRLGDAEQTIEAVAASPADADLLKIAAGSPLLLIKRRIKTEEGRYFQYSEDSYRSDKLKFTIQTVPYDPARNRFSNPLGLAARAEQTPSPGPPGDH
jgi:GntR family transcriptional regulator